MTFDASESSEQLGSPVELYEFQYGISFFRYTNQDISYTYLGIEYFPTNIHCTETEESSELARNYKKISVPRDLLVNELFRVYPPSDEVAVRIYKIHRTDVSQERLLDWDGRVLNCTWYSERAELHCENILTSFRRKGLRRPYQLQCPHDLYSVGPGLCNADKAAKLVVANITAIDGVFLSAAEIGAEAGDYFRGGIVEWEASEDTWVLRAIRNQDGDTIELAQPIFEITAGASVDLYPGCSHDLSASGCRRHVEVVTGAINVPNYGGTLVSRKNPFTTGIG